MKTITKVDEMIKICHDNQDEPFERAGDLAFYNQDHHSHSEL